MKSKKIILFIVEGITDRVSLGLILSRIIKSNSVQFQIVFGDITSDNRTTSQNAITKVNDQVKKFLASNGGIFRKSDIIEVVQLVDLDGAYIPQEHIIKGCNEKLIYTNENIIALDVEKIKERNKRKSSVLNKLSTTSCVGGINYRMYYFSSNLEHVLHNKQCVEDSEKYKYADCFEEKFSDREEQFIDFIKNSSFSVEGDFSQSWEFVKEGLRSLNRYSNFNIFFQK
ncbi:hypothetical protein QOZ83_10710 [Romboutsia sedimentorum]|uniref:hypothetical protein n=1 Tax=Romboutsia sedimentorum TaxID=1368474 RepID=UPI0024DE7EBE|nr:hypothetical protein [Romboutsia sedimentorum]MDK2586333.1 hypothetical protein [Romboutsia sedimentorum]